MSRSSFPSCIVGFSTLHCRLSGAIDCCLYCAVLVCAVCDRLVLFLYLLFNFVHRCRALPNNLDGPESSDRRSRAHTDFLLGKCELSVLYKDYGIIGNVIVCIKLFGSRSFLTLYYIPSHSPMIFLGPTYMNSSLQISSINLLKGFSRTIW